MCGNVSSTAQASQCSAGVPGREESPGVQPSRAVGTRGRSGAEVAAPPRCLRQRWDWSLGEVFTFIQQGLPSTPCSTDLGARHSPRGSTAPRWEGCWSHVGHSRSVHNSMGWLEVGTAQGAAAVAKLARGRRALWCGDSSGTRLGGPCLGRGVPLPFSSAGFCSKTGRRGSGGVDGVCLSGPAQPVIVGTNPADPPALVVVQINVNSIPPA